MENKELIEDLFKTPLFKEKLDQYISDNLKIVVAYDAYEGEYDMPIVYFGEHIIKVEITKYGI